MITMMVVVLVEVVDGDGDDYRMTIIMVMHDDNSDHKHDDENSGY